MDIKQIEELKAKKLLLKAEIRLKQMRERVESQITHLERIGETYDVYYNFEHLNWIESNVRIRNRDGYHGIHGDFQIDVNDSDINNFNIIKEVDFNSEKFSMIFKSIITGDNPLVICYQGGNPELKISVNSFLSNPNEFFSHPETWIITTDKNWIIEYIWEQEIVRFIQLNDSIPTLIMKLKIEQE